MAPLLGPIGGGLGLGAASPSAGAAVVAAAGGAAASSEARTTSLKLLELLFFGGKNSMLLLEPEFTLVATLGVSENPEAADAMLQLAITFSFFLSLFLFNWGESCRK